MLARACKPSADGWPVDCLVSELAVAEHALRLFGSCGWAAGVHALGARLGPPIIEAWRNLDDDWFSSLDCWLRPS